MVAINLDLRNTTPNLGGAIPTKPDGWYDGMIVDSKSAQTKDGAQTGNTMLVLTIGYQDGTSHIERFNLWHQNEDARRIASENLAAICRAMGMTDAEMAIADSTAMHNRVFSHYLAIEESKTDQGKVLKQNRLKAVRMKDGKIIGNVPSAPPAGATAAGGPAPTPGGFTAAPPAPVPGNGSIAPTPAVQTWGTPPQGGAAPAPGAPAAPGGFPAPGAPAAPPAGGFPAPGAPAGGGFPAPGAPAGGGFPAPGAPGPGGFPAPGAPQGWGGPQQ